MKTFLNFKIYVIITLIILSFFACKTTNKSKQNYIVYDNHIVELLPLMVQKVKPKKLKFINITNNNEGF